MAWWYGVKQVFLCMFLLQYSPENTVNNATGFYNYEGMKNGTFPKGRKDGRITYWLESKIQCWILETAEAASKN